MSSAPNAQGSVNAIPEQSEIRHARRNVWILTGYAVTGLAMLGVIFYSVAQYATH